MFVWINREPTSRDVGSSDLMCRLRLLLRFEQVKSIDTFTEAESSPGFWLEFAPWVVAPANGQARLPLLLVVKVVPAIAIAVLVFLMVFDATIEFGKMLNHLRLGPSMK